MGPTAVKKRKPGTRFEEKIRRQNYALRTALRQRNRCLYSPLPTEEARRLSESPTRESYCASLLQDMTSSFPQCLDEVRVPKDKQPKRGWEEREREAKIVWRRILQHVETLPQQVEFMQKQTPPLRRQLKTHCQAVQTVEQRRDSVWRSFILTRVVPRLALLAEEEEAGAVRQWESLQNTQQEAIAESQRLEMQRRGQTPSKSTLLQQLRGIQSRKKRFREFSTSTSITLHGSAVTPQQQLHALLGFRVPLSPLGPSAETQAAAASEAAKTLATRTRQPFLQFLVDLQFVNENQEDLLQQPPQTYVESLVEAFATAPFASESAFSRDASSSEANSSDDPLAPAEEEGVKGEKWEDKKGDEEAPASTRVASAKQAIESFLSITLPERGMRLMRDINVFARLLQVGEPYPSKREPPSVSEEAKRLVRDLRELHESDFTRFLARVYKFAKEWSLSGRTFLLTLVKRQQLLCFRPSACSYDSDTDNLEAAIDCLAVTWRGPNRFHQEKFLNELDVANAHYRQALATPLIQAIASAARGIPHL